MSINQERLKEFIDVIEAETGRRITDEEAIRLAHKFLHLYELLYSTYPGEKMPPAPTA